VRQEIIPDTHRRLGERSAREQCEEKSERQDFSWCVARACFLLLNRFGKKRKNTKKGFDAA
jgi:hypothetical protein